MTVKLNHYWEIIQGQSAEYNKFIIHKFIPGVNKLGMHTVAGWSVLVGAYSEIIFETACNDLNLLEHALKDNTYRTLKSNLLNYVKNYKTKVLIATGKKDAYTRDVGQNTVKFNQMWDLISEKKAEYGQFTRQEFYPLLEKMGVSVAREWEVLIGDGPNIICEGRATDINSLIQNLQSKKFQKTKNKLKEYTERYESRILTFHIQKIKGYKSASYEIMSS
jgi:hypothetical protein